MASKLQAAEQAATDGEAEKEDALQAISALCTHTETTFLAAGCARDSVVKVTFAYKQAFCLCF